MSAGLRAVTALPEFAWRWASAVALALPLACGGDIVYDDDENGGVDRDGLVVRLVVPADDSTLAATLGWSGRGIPGAEVWVQRQGADHRIGLPVSAISDALGYVEFPDLLSGTYRVSALRVLEQDEIARLPSGRPNLRAYGGAMKMGLGEFDLVLDPNRDGLVVSEVSATDKAGVSYIWFGYVEVYNNSDTTIHLDGKLLGRFYARPRSALDKTCGAIATYSNDAAGIWARLFYRFPGDGTQYPLPPGATAVIAQDAIDHRQVDSDFLDLSGADFEFRTASDPDNPTVPDMIDYGTRTTAGNGVQFIPGVHAVFLADFVERDALPRARVLSPLVDDEYVQIPQSSVRDVWTWINGDPTSPTEICSSATNAIRDRMTFDYRRDNTTSHLFSQHRRVVGTTAAGRIVLLDTGTSSVDLVTAPRTPGGQF